MTTPAITLTANLDSILGGALEGGFLRITLCGFGPVTPTVPGAMLADAGIPQFLGPQQSGSTPLQTELFGNDVIQPAGTFYEISVLDANKNVIQANNYQLTGSGTQDLSTLVPALPPFYLGFQLTKLAYQLCTGQIVGGNQEFTAGGPPCAVALNGILLDPSRYSIAGNVITLNFNPDPGDKIYALCLVG